MTALSSFDSNDGRVCRDYRAMLSQIESLMDAEAGTPDGERFDVLVTLVEAWERRPQLVPVDATPGAKRIGVAKGRFEAPDNVDTHNDEVTRLLLGQQA